MSKQVDQSSDWDKFKALMKHRRRSVSTGWGAGPREEVSAEQAFKERRVLRRGATL